MKKAEKLQDAIGMIDGRFIEEAESYKRKSRKKWISLIAALLCVAIIAGVLLHPSSSPIALDSYAISEAEYPEMPTNPNIDGADYDEWFDRITEMESDYVNDPPELDSFITDTASLFLSDTRGENMIYSPINLYMALAMAAEISGGESRAQILELLGCSDIAELREDANAVWKATYKNDGLLTTVLANSVWLSNSFQFKTPALEALTQNYYASSYTGSMGSDEFDRAYRGWLNEQTGGLLTDQIDSLEFDEETLLALASTIYFKGKWADEFNQENNDERVFHTPDKDVTCEFMNDSVHGSYFYGDKFTAVFKSLIGNAYMMFILPDEGKTPEELITTKEAGEFILNGPSAEWENTKSAIINMSIPKFDVSSQTNLSQGLIELGITDIFDQTKADFSPLTDNNDIVANSVVQGARVVIDEQGCTAASYTIMLCDGTAAPVNEIDFVLDRPFIFVIYSRNGLPLYIGTVNSPTK